MTRSQENSMNATQFRAAISFLWLFLLTSPATAELKLPNLFSDHMVLQRDREAAVWGVADAGAEVHVALDGQTVQATADQDGKWRATLDAHAAGGPHTLVV